VSDTGEKSVYLIDFQTLCNQIETTLQELNLHYKKIPFYPTSHSLAQTAKITEMPLILFTFFKCL